MKFDRVRVIELKIPLMPPECPPDTAATGPAPLAGQVVLVTGGAVRVGRAICRELGRAGARVVVHHHRSAGEAAALAAELGGGALTARADLRSADATAAMFRAVTAQTGRIDALINNAATFARTPLRTPDDASWETAWAAQLETNLTAPARCTRHAVAAGARAIVNLVDIAAWQPWREFAAYAAAKAGLLQLTRVLSRELAPEVRVNAVAPGIALFPADYDASSRERMRKRVPLGREGTPEDVARAVRFLLTEPYLTGTCLPVDGGAGLR